MKLGTQIRMSDGRKGTVVYNSLIGIGIKWGLHDPDPSDFEGTTGNLCDDKVDDDWPWEPDAILRDPWPSCKEYGFDVEDCVGADYRIIRSGLVEEGATP